MNCPRCNKGMTAGQFSVESSPGQVLRSGYSEMSPVFTPRNGKPIALTTHETVLPAFRCVACDLTLIMGYKGANTECLQCGKIMTHDESRCSACGWTYE